ncbi:MAG: peptidase, partial [Gemmatimonadota bacterium]
PIGDHLVDAAGKPLSNDAFFVPGSLLRVQVDTASVLARGAPAEVDVMFENSPAFRVAPGTPGVRVVARFDGDAPLRSGWAWGQAALKGGAAIVEADVGKGLLVLYGPEVLFRAQPHGTFPFFFNGLYRLATTTPAVP